MNTNLEFVAIGNNQQEITSTNYWKSAYAKMGICWLSRNAGAVRLLLPKPQERYIAEIFTGKSVTLEPSLAIRNNFDVVFEDGTNSPFFISISPKAMDFNLRALKGERNIPFTVWTEAGKLCSFIAKVK